MTNARFRSLCEWGLLSGAATWCLRALQPRHLFGNLKDRSFQALLLEDLICLHETIHTRVSASLGPSYRLCVTCRHLAVEGPNWNSKDSCKLGETTRADAVFSILVLLNLLKRDAYLLAESRLRKLLP